MTIAVVLGAVVYLVVGLRLASDCGTSFGLFGTEDSSAVRSCIGSRRWIGPVVFAAVLLGGAAICSWGRRSRWETGPVRQPGADCEVLYSTVDWTDTQLMELTELLTGKQISWYVNGDDLIVDKRYEHLVDLLVARITGEIPRNV